MARAALAALDSLRAARMAAPRLRTVVSISVGAGPGRVRRGRAAGGGGRNAPPWAHSWEIVLRTGEVVSPLSMCACATSGNWVLLWLPQMMTFLTASGATSARTAI